METLLIHRTLTGKCQPTQQSYIPMSKKMAQFKRYICHVQAESFYSHQCFTWQALKAIYALKAFHACNSYMLLLAAVATGQPIISFKNTPPHIQQTVVIQDQKGLFRGSWWNPLDHSQQGGSGKQEARPEQNLVIQIQSEIRHIKNRISRIWQVWWNFDFAIL